MTRKESYAEHGRFIVEGELALTYRAHHPQMPEFIEVAIRIFANRELA